MSDQTIIRTPHSADRPFVATCRATAQDRKLSWEARGMLWYLLSKPDDWQVIVSDLMQNCGRDKVRKILAELIQFGYLEKSEEQPHAEHGHFSSPVYRVHEAPLTEKPSTVEPSTVEPSTVKPTLHNREVVHNKENNISPSGEYLKLFAFTPSAMDEAILDDLLAEFTDDLIISGIREIHTRGVSNIKYLAKMVRGGWRPGGGQRRNGKKVDEVALRYEAGRALAGAPHTEEDIQDMMKAMRGDA